MPFTRAKNVPHSAAALLRPHRQQGLAGRKPARRKPVGIKPARRDLESGTRRAGAGRRDLQRESRGSGGRKAGSAKRKPGKRGPAGRFRTEGAKKRPPRSSRDGLFRSDRGVRTVAIALRPPPRPDKSGCSAYSAFSACCGCFSCIGFSLDAASSAGFGSS